MVVGPKLLDDWCERMKFPTNKAACDYLGLAESTVCKLRKGTREAGLDVALKLERLTGIPVEAWSDVSDTLVMAGAPPQRKSLKDK